MTVTPEPTQRLRFRAMAPDDLDAMARLLGDPEVMRHYPHPKSRDEAAAWIAWNQRNYAEYGLGLWIIELRDTGDFIGDCGLTWQGIDGGRVLEAGYHVLPEHQGRGYATEAARACVAYGFQTTDEERVTAIIVPENAASRAVAERIGMHVDHETTDRQGLAVVLYAIGREQAR